MLDIIETVDELIRRKTNSCVNENGAVIVVCNYLYRELLKTLMSESNKPSKYDLLIISEAEKIISFKYPTEWHERLHQEEKDVMRFILSIYKNRK